MKMKEIKYTFKITQVTPTGMVIEYSSEGLPTIPVGVPVPKSGEYATVEEAIDSIQKVYAPIAYWQDLMTPVMEIPLNYSSTATASLIPEVDRIEPQALMSVDPVVVKSISI